MPGRALSSATFVVVFDATGSMEEFALETANSILAALNIMPKEAREKSSLGFVFYLDADDEENLVEIAPMPFEDAANVLRKAADLMSGGGDVAEPVLDAVYCASHLYDWGQAGRGTGECNTRRMAWACQRGWSPMGRRRM